MKNIKSILSNDTFQLAASVFSPLSAAIAQDAGFRCGVVGGSVVAAISQNSPDYGLITLTELADQVRRICMHNDLPIIVDGDSGYGNALNTQRLVRELEQAGASAVTLEDSLLPFQYKQRHALSALEEHKDKLLAALAVRKSAEFSIIARTKLQSGESFPNLIKRIEAYSQTGVDAICIFGDAKRSDLRIIKEITNLPIMLISYTANRHEFKHYEYSGVRILLNGHHAFEAAVRGMYHAYQDILTPSNPEISAKDILAKYSSTRAMDEVARKFMSL